MRIYLEPPSEAHLKRLIMQEIVDQLDKTLSSIRNGSERKIRDLTRKIIKNTSFINDISNILGDLRGEFGLRAGQAKNRANEIINQIVDDTHLIYSSVKLIGNTDIEGGWILAMGTDLFEKLKQSSAGITISEKKESIDWLRWSLEQGNKIIIADFSVQFRIGAGRSGLAIMVPNNIVGWRIPPSFAGTHFDNWITRAIIPRLDEYSKILFTDIKRMMK